MTDDVSGALTCSASVIGSPDATRHSGAARVNETQNQAKQMRAAASGVNMHCYSELTLLGQG